MHVLRTSKEKGEGERADGVSVSDLFQGRWAGISKETVGEQKLQEGNSQTSKIPPCRFFHCPEHDIWPQRQQKMHNLTADARYACRSLKAFTLTVIFSDKVTKIFESWDLLRNVCE